MAENTIESLLEEKRIFYPPSEFSKKAHIKSFEEYKQIYERSISDPESFWAEQAHSLNGSRNGTKSIFGMPKKPFAAGSKGEN